MRYGRWWRPPRPGQLKQAHPGRSPSPLVREFELEDRSGLGTNAETLEAIPIPKPTAGYVPAGSYAEAVVLAGADASAGVQSQGDPRPVLLRLTSPAYGAAVDGTAETTDVEGCTITGAAYGDLSSEKVYVRLQTMACAGEALGTVMNARVRVRRGRRQGRGTRGGGEPRGCAGPEAFLAGLFSGFGESATQAFRPQAVLAGGGDGDRSPTRVSTTSGARGSAPAPVPPAGRSAITSSAGPNSISRSSNWPRARP